MPLDSGLDWRLLEGLAEERRRIYGPSWRDRISHGCRAGLVRTRWARRQRRAGVLGMSTTLLRP